MSVIFNIESLSYSNLKLAYLISLFGSVRLLIDCVAADGIVFEVLILIV